MILFADTPTLGLLIGGPLVLLTLIVCAAVAYLGFRSNDGYGDGRMAGVVAVLVGLATLVGALFGFWPLKHDYHFWQDKSGTVTQVSKRLVPAGDKGMEEKIVLVIDGHPYGITDTRAALTKVGDHVSLSCKRAYQWGSTDHGWDCRWSQ